MASKKFKLIDDVVDKFQLYFQKQNFLSNSPQILAPDFLKSELNYVMSNIPYKISEAAIRENILYPVLKEVFKKQKINDKPDLPVLGIVTNGDNWEFGKLEGTMFTENEGFYTILQVDALFSTLTSFFELCNQNAVRL